MLEVLPFFLQPLRQTKKLEPRHQGPGSAEAEQRAVLGFAARELSASARQLDEALRRLDAASGLLAGDSPRTAVAAYMAKMLSFLTAVSIEVEALGRGLGADRSQPGLRDMKPYAPEGDFAAQGARTAGAVVALGDHVRARVPHRQPLGAAPGQMHGA